MGEICSAYPTAGGLYFWSAKLARRNGARWSWFTGWFNLLGQIGVIASVDYALAIFIGYFIRMFDDSYRLTVLGIFGIFLLVLIAHGLLNTFGVYVIRILGDISVWWHVFGVVVIFFVLMIVPDDTIGLDSVLDQAPPGLTGWTEARSSPSTSSGSACCWRSTRHRVRRVGPRQRGDLRRPHGGAEGHRPGDLRVGDRRLLPQPLDDAGDPGGSRSVSPIAFGGPDIRSWSTPRLG